MLKVLLPVDGSAHSWSTLTWASEYLNCATTCFFLLYVVPKNIPEPVVEEYEIEEAVDLLKSAKRFLEHRGCMVERAEYVLGDAVDSICRYAHEMRVEQIIMGSRGRTGVTKVLLGSVSGGVMERCDIPVFVCRGLIGTPKAR